MHRVIVFDHPIQHKYHGEHDAKDAETEHIYATLSSGKFITKEKGHAINLAWPEKGINH